VIECNRFFTVASYSHFTSAPVARRPLLPSQFFLSVRLSVRHTGDSRLNRSSVSKYVVHHTTGWCFYFWAKLRSPEFGGSVRTRESNRGIPCQNR